MDVNVSLLEKIRKGHFTFSEMVELLTHVWILDMGSVFEECASSETASVQLYLGTGVWEDNKAILRALKQNKEWWNKYFCSQCGDNTYLFSED